jgi:hypothetical protein
MRADRAVAEEIAERPMDLAGGRTVPTKESPVVAVDGLGLIGDLDVVVEEGLERLARGLPAFVLVAVIHEVPPVGSLGFIGHCSGS